MHKVQKAVAVLRDQYRSATPREFVRFLRDALFWDERILVYCLSLPEGIPASTRATTLGRIVKGLPADLEAARARLDRTPWELQCDKYDGVRDFFVYKEHGRVGHISWLYYKHDPNRVLRLNDGECEIKFCLTFSEWRGQGLYPSALETIQHYLAAGGYRRCFICVKQDNLSSIRGIEKAGFRRAGAVRVRKAFGLQITRPRDTSELRDQAPA